MIINDLEAGKKASVVTKCANCRNETCDCWPYLRRFGNSDVPEVLRDYVCWDEPDERLSKSWFQHVLHAVQAQAQDLVDCLMEDYESRFDEDEEGFSAYEQFEELKEAAGLEQF